VFITWHFSAENGSEIFSKPTRDLILAVINKAGVNNKKKIILISFFTLFDHKDSGGLYQWPQQHSTLSRQY
jgi:hypothetical protein